MLRYFLLTATVLCCLVTIESNAAEYPVSAIPAALLKNANMVKRIETESFTLKNPGEATYKMKYAVTILNEAGDRYSSFYQYYDKFIEIKSIEGTLYDAAGKELKKLKKKDIQDRSGVDDNNLMDDNRLKVHDFYYKAYPYTVEYEVELKYNGTMFYPDWFPQSRSLLSVQESSFTFSCPENYEFRYKAYQFSGTPAISSEKGNKVYTWKVTNLPAIVAEPFSAGIRKIAPLVLLGPTEFEMQGYKGNMKSWQDLGKFIYTLKQGRDALPDNVKQAVHQLTDNLTDTKQKIERLYDYLQNNTRYISIQLGIGGWQPFDAGFVAAKKYGDCKALSNYMGALLKEAGIPSNYVTIRAGENEDEIFADFPSSQFNHAILCVPLPKDTIWLECTDQYKAAGYMGSFTGNRYALMVDEAGGKLVRTPAYEAMHNQQVRNIKATLEEDGTLNVKSSTAYQGTEQDDIQYLFNRVAKNKWKEYLHDKFDFSTYDVSRFEYTEKKSVLPFMEETLDIAVSNYATITGKRLFIVPNVMTRSGLKLSKDSTRKYDIVVRNAYTQSDSVEIQLPKGYKAEATPPPATLSSRFGNYKSTVSLRDNKIVYYRTVQYNSGTYPAKEYPELVKFYEDIYKADRSRIVLVKSEASDEKKAF